MTRVNRNTPLTVERSLFLLPALFFWMVYSMDWPGIHLFPLDNGKPSRAFNEKNSPLQLTCHRFTITALGTCTLSDLFFYWWYCIWMMALRVYRQEFWVRVLAGGGRSGKASWSPRWKAGSCKVKSRKQNLPCHCSVLLSQEAVPSQPFWKGSKGERSGDTLLPIHFHP